MARLLVIDDEQASCRTLKLHFEQRGFDVETASGADEGLAVLSDDSFDLVISDIRMPGRDGLSLLGEIHQKTPDLPVIMITAFQDLDSTVAAMHGGAVDYVPKPIDLDELEAAVDRALRSQTGHSGDDIVFDQSDATGTIVGRSAAMQEVFKQIGIASQNRVNILIQGESGSGKEVIARAIHKVGTDADKLFVAVNCSSLVETFLESELFGHEVGAFSEANNERTGKVALAGEGTLFLDEANELSPHLQSKLLRLLEDREYTPIGGTREMNSQARYIVSTNVDLASLVAEGRFREDLYYRLGVFTISIPPLRERTEDIPLLVEHLLNKINRETRKNINRVPSELMELLIAYDWPGNVRQLENVLMKAVVMASGDVLSVSYLPDEIVSGGKSSDHPTSVDSQKTLKELERSHILSALTETGWHKGRTCKILGISRPRLERRIAEFGFTRDG